jgi:cellulose synthase/poly-beta-1,6-N-acetylglucosamine synthase-like glycosyltransferase
MTDDTPSTGPSYGRPSCSVVIPVRNDARVLDRCLTALEHQTVGPLEVIVVDNGSDDDSVAVALRHGATVLHERRIGIAAAAAHGYDAARGELVLRLDADSVPPADWTARIARRFAADPDIDALTGPGVFTAVPRPLRPVLTDWYWRVYFERLGSRVGAKPLFGSNLAMRATAWRAVSAAVHREDVMVHDDLDLSIHLVQAERRLGLDPQLRVSVSARPLLHPFGMLQRARRAAHTFALHEEPPASAGRFRSRDQRRASRDPSTAP